MEHKQANGAKLCANIRSWRAKNAPKLYPKYLKDRMWKIKQYFIYILMIIKQNILAIIKTFLNLQKKLWNSTPSELPQLLLLNLFAKFLTERKHLINTLIYEAEISLDEIIKFINSETNNKPPGNDGLTTEFYSHFWNELAPVLLGVYDSWGKIDTMGVTCQTGIMSVISAVSRTS